VGKNKIQHRTIPCFNTHHIMSEPFERIQTHAKNADQHPGLVVTKRKRRTPAQMDEDRNNEKKEREERAKLQEDKLRRIARLEDELSARDFQARQGIVDTLGPRKKNTQAPISNNNIDVDDDGHTNTEFVDMSDGHGTSDEFVPDDKPDTSDSDDEEEPEPEPEPIAKKQRRVQKSEVRGSIKEYRGGQPVRGE
jgi:hypothetical protein